MKELHIFHSNVLTVVNFTRYDEVNNILFVYQEDVLIALFTNYDWYDVV